MNLCDIENEALHLPVEERAKLAQRLLESLDELSEQEAEKLWLVEAEHSAQEIDGGKVQLISAEDVERRILTRLK